MRICPASLTLMIGIPLAACAPGLSQDEANSLYAGLPQSKKEAVAQANAAPPGEVTGDVLVAAMFAKRCDGIAADSAFVRLMEPQLVAYRNEEGSDASGQFDLAVERLAAKYHVLAPEVRSAETGCPIALQEIGAATVIGSALFVEGA